MDIKLGNKDIPFIYQGDELLYPNPIKDGLVLWYDFKGMSNNDKTRDVAVDLSGNGNHGTLRNFGFNDESGYQNRCLTFDGVDDYISILEKGFRLDTYQDTFSFVVEVKEDKRNNLLYSGEELKIDLRGDTIYRADVTPTASARENILDRLVSIYLVKTTSSHTTYVNGIPIEEREIDSYKKTAISFIGNYIPQGRPNIDLYDVKVYNRPLTPEEIAHNYQIEKERFGIE